MRVADFVARMRTTGAKLRRWCAAVPRRRKCASVCGWG